ncbi:PHP domain-containing protein [Streptomyces cellulosae]|uniref:PHP domain-containing protein n=2 Tax=Streptomyces TaxID=1883 RepID=A0ABU3J214_9ACTN|nr:PHP domain-containing protein [Streptomyces sp. McG7]MBT2903329.1 PHP domain-containing protein [Streptomyces sp. McG8]MDQ0485778.1 putative metal-dependent phosphoesterase TrpH [Streptomyces thermodiastaticus]MDT6969102.1 PHP domain-containing protein [Streptomyces thermocarboxydus]MDX3417146.1 PHP domain-containing protein [Streptomyces sp. MD20-1-1]MYQ35687.1 PHP domain-containing protein [Streptomyces sp. SID4956]MYW56378.1 PHP domain-containing protein [Streptomyces sp. SID8376]THC56
MRIDLHTHSTASDGTDTPADLVRKAAAAGLDVVALTDHDTTRGHAEALAALPQGLTLVTGAELSCRLDGVSMHLLAYLFDPEEPALLAERELVRDDRVPRAKGMIAKLNELGVPVTWEQVARIAGNGSVGRPHVASALVELGVVDSVSDAFTPEWLADGGRAYVPKHETDPFEAVRLVKNAGGVAVFAHPAAVKRGRTVPDSAIAELARAGLDGIEVDHMDHDPGTRARLRGLAGELGLLVTGSSDYHGSRKTCVLGEFSTDPEVYGEITRRATGAFPVPGTGGAV